MRLANSPVSSAAARDSGAASGLRASAGLGPRSLRPDGELGPVGTTRRNAAWRKA